MKTDAHENNSAVRDRQHTVKHSFSTDAVQRAIDRGVDDWENETERRFFASQHAPQAAPTN